MGRLTGTGTPTQRGRLVARAERIERGSDLLPHYRPGDGFFFEHPSGALVTSGVAVSIAVPAGPAHVATAAGMAEAALARIETTAGPSPMVVGALPFDGTSPATLVVPRIAWIRSVDGSAWRIDVGPEGEPGETAPEPAERLARSTATNLDVTPLPAPQAYVQAVDEARRRIRRGDLDKVVLARMLVVRAGHDFDRLSLLERLRLTEPDAFVFAAQGFLGATPELLVARAGSTVRANPLAGTSARGPDSPSDRAAAEALLASTKDLHEHELVVEAVRSGLAEACEQLDIDPYPAPMATGRLWHLSTEVRGTLRRPAPNALALAALLHPTPAVCGTPRDAAVAAIRDLERIDRTLYAGVVGWMNADGDGEWAIALRCAEIQGQLALLFAGAGIVGDSDPEAELAETDAKFRAMLDALGWA
jgi:isochorismate synthase